MFRRSRLVRGLKWAGTLVCLLVLAAFVASAWYETLWRPNSRLGIVIDRGSLTIAFDFKRPPTMDPRIGFMASAHGCELQWYVRPFTQRSIRAIDFVVNPIWFVLLVAAAPTLLLWFIDRRRVPPGHCRKCRYNLTGNTTGRCPECGAAFAPAAR